MKYVKKISACIIREVADKKEILVFSHKDYPKIPLQLPGGTVEQNEELTDALYREILEESGLTKPILIRKLGSKEYFSYYTNYERHFFILKINEAPDTWSYRVTGKGSDRGLIFDYQWLDYEEILRIYSLS